MRLHQRLKVVNKAISSTIHPPSFKTSSSNINICVVSPISNYDKWFKSRFIRLIICHLLDQRFIETAERIAHSVIQDDMKQTDHVDIDLFRKIQTIVLGLEQHDLNECLNWCIENRLILKKLGADLEFFLRRQEFIELSRSRNLEYAIQYVKLHLSFYWDNQSRDVKQILALLALGPATNTEPYKSLYDLEQWQSLAQQFRKTFYDLYGLPARSQLLVAMQAGLASLKTPACLCKRSSKLDLETKNFIFDQKESPQQMFDCPVCSWPLSYLADSMPITQQQHSSLVCWISGLTMDEYNPPMMLPNGYVYSLNSLAILAGQNLQSSVKCPRTGFLCDLKDARKCFIL